MEMFVRISNVTFNPRTSQIEVLKRKEHSGIERETERTNLNPEIEPAGVEIFEP